MSHPRILRRALACTLTLGLVPALFTPTAFAAETTPAPDAPAPGTRDWAIQVLGHGRVDDRDSSLDDRARLHNGLYGQNKPEGLAPFIITDADLRQALSMAWEDWSILPAALTVADQSRHRANSTRGVLDEAFSAALSSGSSEGLS